jgi:hypothetical protein
LDTKATLELGSAQGLGGFQIHTFSARGGWGKPSDLAQNLFRKRSIRLLLL